MLVSLMKPLQMLLIKCILPAEVCKIIFFICLFNFGIHLDLIIAKRYEEAYEKCEKMSDFILNEAQKKLGRSINPYDIKLDCPVPGCFDISNVR